MTSKPYWNQWVTDLHRYVGGRGFAPHSKNIEEKSQELFKNHAVIRDATYPTGIGIAHGQTDHERAYGISQDIVAALKHVLMIQVREAWCRCIVFLMIGCVAVRDRAPLQEIIPLMGIEALDLASQRIKNIVYPRAEKVIPMRWIVYDLALMGVVAYTSNAWTIVGLWVIVRLALEILWGVWRGSLSAIERKISISLTYYDDAMKLTKTV